MDRSLFYERRRQIPDRERAEKAIFQRVLPFLNTSEWIGLYYPVRGEVDIWQFLKDWPKVCLPRVLDETQMVFYPPRGLEKGAFGILEPLRTEEIAPAVILIPMVGYQGCHRLGNGKGYYDRYLAAHPHALKIGIAFEQQEGEFEMHPWDIEMDVVITPDQIIKKEDL